MPARKYTSLIGSSRDAVTAAAGTVVSGGVGVEVNVDFNAATTVQDVTKALDHVKAKLMESWPPA